MVAGRRCTSDSAGGAVPVSESACSIRTQPTVTTATSCSTAPSFAPDTFGRPLRFHVTAGQAHDITAAADLLEGRKAKAVLADNAYDDQCLARTD